LQPRLHSKDRATGEPKATCGAEAKGDSCAGILEPPTLPIITMVATQINSDAAVDFNMEVARNVFDIMPVRYILNADKCKSTRRVNLC
jgi:hypothetical protein